MDQIQGRNATLKLFVNGSPVSGIPIKEFEWEGDGEIRKRDLLGAPRSKAQLILDGYKGTFKWDVENPRHHEIIRFLNEAEKNSDTTFSVAIQITESYRDGSFKSYRFDQVTLMIPKTTARGRKEDIENQVEWFAEDIVYLQ